MIKNIRVRIFSTIVVALLGVFVPTGARAAKSGELVAPRQKASAAEAAKMRAKCPPIAFIERDAYGMSSTNAVMFAIRTGVGAAIRLYDPARPEATARTIFETKKGFIFNMNPSYDGRRLVFSHKTAPNEPFHVWEINVDGTGLRQLTDGRYHDFSPVYYPDGRIIFSSSRVESFSVCQNFLACGLHIIDSDGSNLRRFDFTTLNTLTPFVLDDGSILCTRWEYNDKNIFAWEGLWTINPNGRQLKLYHGNTFRVPNAVYGARQIPGTNRVLTVWAGHHLPPIGDLGIIDRSLGTETPESMWKVTHVTPVEKDIASGKNWRDTGIGTSEADTLYAQAFADPFPFTPDLTVTSFGGDDPRRHNLYILNHNTGETCLLYQGERSCFSPVPLHERARPSVIEGECPQEKGFGTYFVQDVYRGLERQGVRRGQIDRLRVMSQSPKKYNTEGPRYHDHYPVVGHGSYYVKINHGTAPVDENGAAYFRVPSNTELYFIALDKNGKEVQRMGSVTQITTDETASCVGCHENRFHSPASTCPASMKRMRRPPDEITPPSWGAGPVDFVRQVQPILDKYCAECHSGASPEGGVDLSGDKTRFYNMAYESLVFDDFVDYYYINQGPNGVFPALATGSWVSKLTELIEKKHAKVDMDAESRRCVFAWIDANIPYYSTWDMTRPHTMGGRDAYAHTQVVDGKIRGGSVPEPWVAKFNDFVARNGMGEYKILLGNGNQYTPRSRINLTHPEWSPVLTTHLSKKEGGLAAPEKAIFASKTEDKYTEFLGILSEAAQALATMPRVDMDGAVAIAQERDFGKTF